MYNSITPTIEQKTTNELPSLETGMKIQSAYGEYFLVKNTMQCVNIKYNTMLTMCLAFRESTLKIWKNNELIWSRYGK